MATYHFCSTCGNGVNTDINEVTYVNGVAYCAACFDSVANLRQKQSDGSQVIYARFTTAQADEGTVYVVSTVGQLGYGVPCINSGRLDWMVFDTITEANEYVEFAKGF